MAAAKLRLSDGQQHDDAFHLQHVDAAADLWHRGRA